MNNFQSQSGKNVQSVYKPVEMFYTNNGLQQVDLFVGILSHLEEAIILKFNWKTTLFSLVMLERNSWRVIFEEYSGPILSYKLLNVSIDKANIISDLKVLITLL